MKNDVKKDVKKKSNNFLKFIMKHKLLTILLVLMLLILIFGIVAFKVLIFPNYSTDKYGDRLNGIESVQLSDSKFDDIKKTETVEGFNVSKVELSGRIVNIYVNVTGELDRATCRDNSNKLLANFSEDELKFYDIQIFITGESDIYPMIGYKSKISEGLRWNYEGEK